MARLAYKLKNIQERNVGTLLVSGFIGQLKNLWDNALGFQDKFAIFDHTIEVEDTKGNIQAQSDAAKFLIVTLAMYFLGNPKEELNANKGFLKI